MKEVERIMQNMKRREGKNVINCLHCHRVSQNLDKRPNCSGHPRPCPSLGVIQKDCIWLASLGLIFLEGQSNEILNHSLNCLDFTSTKTSFQIIEKGSDDFKQHVKNRLQISYSLWQYPYKRYEVILMEGIEVYFIV